MKLALALVVVGSSVASAGPCAFPTPHVVVFGTPQIIDQRGGVVAGVMRDFGGDGPAALDKLDWTLGGKAPSVKLLAPDLAVLAPATPPPGKELVLEDGKKTTLAKLKYVDALGKLGAAAPQVRSITWSHSQGQRSSSTSVSAALGAVPPANTVAVLIYKNGEQKAGKLARAWAGVNVAGDPKATGVILFSQSRCSSPVGGGDGLGQGEKLVLVWVASDGTLSPPSAEFTVK